MQAGVDDPAGDKAFVRIVATAHDYPIVRAGAWSALLSSDPDAAVARFLATDYEFLIQRAQQTAHRNLEFCTRVRDTTNKEHTPEVHAAATYAVASGSAGIQAEFVRTGYAAAQLRDRQAREAKGEHEQALVEADWVFVRNLAAHDPGEQVRASATWATRPVATNTDLVEFFAHGWAYGARLDLEKHRRSGFDNEVRWRARLKTLTEAALAAAKTARETATELAKAAAVKAWQDVGAHSDPARSAWAQAQQLAERQAAYWAGIAVVAGGKTGPNWSAVVDPALGNRTAWDNEQQFGQSQARFWAEQLRIAQEGEQRVRL
ncbi:hypothetical protein AOZ06_17730 [Kibdelosporangium phytohabitans]|uniref:Uncharacterized protein n=1 Tax=Kibdelosporangium phytohabitans TaxID=860235 RepID=A0A0N9I1F0_9PSEU|nr:hypothetical protein AOZ06_17730 [Kibdelosporangium phytohabitans]